MLPRHPLTFTKHIWCYKQLQQSPAVRCIVKGKFLKILWPEIIEKMSEVHTWKRKQRLTPLTTYRDVLMHQSNIDMSQYKPCWQTLANNIACIDVSSRSSSVVSNQNNTHVWHTLLLNKNKYFSGYTSDPYVFIINKRENLSIMRV